MESVIKMSPKKKIGAIISIIIIVSTALVPYFYNESMLSIAGLRTILLLISFLIMLVLEVLPVVVTCLLYVGLMPLLAVTNNLNGALVGYSNPVVFFTLASFGIASALINVPLSNRILAYMLKKFGNSIESVLFMLMVSCALVSALVSNVPCCAVFMALALNFLNLYDNEKDKKQTGKAFMIAIPIASMIGGMMTPVGSSVNLIALQQLVNFGYPEVSFVSWMLVGLPLALVMLPLSWILLCKIYKPVKVSRKQIEKYVDMMDVPKKIDTKERKVIIIILMMLILWVLSSWVKVINTMVVAIIGCCVLFLPGIDVLDVDSFLKNNSWSAFFLVGTVISISTAMNTNGVGDLLAQAIGNILPANISLFVMLALTAVITFVALVIIPVATSLIPLMLPVLIVVALKSNISPVAVTLTMALCSCNCYLLPLDTVPLITYSKGYYEMTDMIKCTIWLQITLVIICALWIPLVGNIIGF